ncbi:unnamed protein product [Nezara viridula]|uniref:LIM zinc-binding domain-containing protein n=1 Tax=Nezara viridula TaxID=85310 RepID=A0A9P0E8B0_NEZVI|nr:unnamed protein product [Nezara viridula]
MNLQLHSNDREAKRVPYLRHLSYLLLIAVGDSLPWRWVDGVTILRGEKVIKGLTKSKLAATTMNPHYHPYSELPSPHSPPPDAGGYANGHHVEHHFPHHHHHHHGNNGGVKVCAGCGGKIVERYLLHALDRYWHNSCLKCTCCGAMLADIGSSCFTKSNMILCKNDYIR